MDFTTTTEIARKGSKIFKDIDEVIVLSNNKPLWALLSYKLYEKLKESWVLEEAKLSLENESVDHNLLLEQNLSEWNDQAHDNLFA